MAEQIERQIFKSYLAMIENSPGTEMFKSLYVRIGGGPVTDIVDGENACAYYASSVLLIFGKIKSPHATVTSTVKDMEESGWLKVDEEDLKPGDVIVWDKRDDDNPSQHIGFYVGDSEAVSTSSSEKKVKRHELHFGSLGRRIAGVYRMADW